MSVNKWLREQWRSRFPEPIETCINDAVYANLVQMFVGRARFWRGVSIGLLVATVVGIGVGINIFRRGDVPTDIRSESEMELANELRGLSDKIAAFREKESIIIHGKSRLERARVLSNELTAMIAGIKNLDSNRKWDSLDSNIRKVEFARIFVKHMDSVGTQPGRNSQDDSREMDPTVFIELPNEVPKLQPFSVSVISMMAREGRQVGIFELDELQRRLSELGNSLVALNRSKPATAEAVISNAQFADVDKRIDSISGDLLRFESLKQKIDDDLRLASRQEQEWKEAAAERAIEIAKLESERDVKRIDLDEARTSRSRILFMAWIPSLTLRVGIVILLLFLTQILLATYRYTVSLSSFYLARADAIRLLQPGEGRGATWYSTEQLNALNQGLTPGHISIDAVTAPTEHLAELAKAWATRNGK